MAITKRLVKGSALTQAELDGNFTDYEGHVANTSNPHGVTKTQVGLSNVDNTSDSTKNAATATLTNKTLTSPVINTPTGIVKGDVGLGNVDNTSDVNKPISTAQQTALDLKVDKEDFTALTYGATTNWDQNNRQNPLASLSIGADTTLNVTNVKSGGIANVIFTKTISGDVIVTLDTDFTNKVLNPSTGQYIPLSTVTLTGVSGSQYIWSGLTTGTTVYWIIEDGSVSSGGSLPAGTSGQIIVYDAGGTGDAVTMSGDCTISNTGVVTIGTNKVTLGMLATLSTGKVIGNLSGSTATPSALDTQDLVVTNTTVQTDLNTESGWSGATKTGISNLEVGQFWTGTNLTDGVLYDYTCVSSGVATRSPKGQSTDIATIDTISQPLAEAFADAGNTGTSVTDLYSYTLPASGTKGNLDANGKKVIVEFVGTTVGSATATRQIEILFGGTVIYDSTAFTTTSNANWVANVFIIRVSTSVVRVGVKFVSSLGSPLSCKYTEVTGLTLSSTQILKIRATAASTGAATNDIVAKSMEVRYIPQFV